MMKVILTKDHPQLGSEGDVVEVAPGYARNYLLPRKLVLPATEHHLRLFKQAQEKKNREEERQIQAAQKLAQRLSGASCTIAVAAGEEDRLFGSVTTADIAAALAKEGFTVDRKQIQLDEIIKKLGIYSVTVKIAPEITAQVKVWVVKE
jgi:large subunit ribosomal protein L9